MIDLRTFVTGSGEPLVYADYRCYPGGGPQNPQMPCPPVTDSDHCYPESRPVSSHYAPPFAGRLPLEHCRFRHETTPPHGRDGPTTDWGQWAGATTDRDLDESPAGTAVRHERIAPSG